MRLRNIPRAEKIIANHEKVVQNGEEQKGRWKELFENQHPIHVEIGMGKGQFILTLARKNPEINYVGIERYGSVLLRALEKCDQQQEKCELENIRFLNVDAARLGEIFEQNEIDRIYLNFSDPWPKARHARRRLTALPFWEEYGVILRSGGKVEFKTDNKELFAFSLEQVKEAEGFEMTEQTWDLHEDKEMVRENVMTEYEEKFSAQGNPICKLTAQRV